MNPEPLHLAWVVAPKSEGLEQRLNQALEHLDPSRELWLITNLDNHAHAVAWQAGVRNRMMRILPLNTALSEHDLPSMARLSEALVLDVDAALRSLGRRPLDILILATGPAPLRRVLLHIAWRLLKGQAAWGGMHVAWLDHQGRSQEVLSPPFVLNQSSATNVPKVAFADGKDHLHAMLDALRGRTAPALAMITGGVEDGLQVVVTALHEAWGGSPGTLIHLFPNDDPPADFRGGTVVLHFDEDARSSVDWAGRVPGRCRAHGATLVLCCLETIAPEPASKGRVAQGRPVRGAVFFDGFYPAWRNSDYCRSFKSAWGKGLPTRNTPTWLNLRATPLAQPVLLGAMQAGWGLSLDDGEMQTLLNGGQPLRRQDMRGRITAAVPRSLVGRRLIIYSRPPSALPASASNQLPSVFEIEVKDTPLSAVIILHDQQDGARDAAVELEKKVLGLRNEHENNGLTRVLSLAVDTRAHAECFCPEDAKRFIDAIRTEISLANQDPAIKADRSKWWATIDGPPCVRMMYDHLAAMDLIEGVLRPVDGARCCDDLPLGPDAARWVAWGLRFAPGSITADSQLPSHAEAVAVGRGVAALWQNSDSVVTVRLDHRPGDALEFKKHRDLLTTSLAETQDDKPLIISDAAVPPSQAQVWFLPSEPGALATLANLRAQSRRLLVVISGDPQPISRVIWAVSSFLSQDVTISIPEFRHRRATWRRDWFKQNIRQDLHTELVELMVECEFPKGEEQAIIIAKALAVAWDEGRTHVFEAVIRELHGIVPCSKGADPRHHRILEACHRGLPGLYELAEGIAVKKGLSGLHNNRLLGCLARWILDGLEMASIAAVWPALHWKVPLRKDHCQAQKGWESLNPTTSIETTHLRETLESLHNCLSSRS